MQPKRILMTQDGFDKLIVEKEKLEKERPAAVLDLKKAREMGDLSENGYYKGARAKLSAIDARIREVTHLIRFAKIAKHIDSDTITLGSKITLQHENGEISYTLVGEPEANPSEKKISHKSPLGRALIDKKIGESVVVAAPTGEKVYTIKSIA